MYSALFKGMHSTTAGKTWEKEKGDGWSHCIHREEAGSEQEVWLNCGPECPTSAILRPLEQVCERNVENFAAESLRNHTREVFLLSSHKPVLKEGT